MTMLVSLRTILQTTANKEVSTASGRAEEAPHIQRWHGDTVQLHCLVEDTDQAQYVTWNSTSPGYRDAIAGGRIRVTYHVLAEERRVHSNLTISVLRRTDAGLYWCSLADTVVPSHAVALVQLTVLAPVSNTFISPHQTVLEGHTTTLICSYSSSFPMNITWLSNTGTPLQPSRNISIHTVLDSTSHHMSITSTVTLHSVTRHMAGQYDCVAVGNLDLSTTDRLDSGAGAGDGMNNASTATIINVLYGPDIVTDLNPAYTYRHDNTSLTCAAAGNPLPTVAWRYSLEKIERAFHGDGTDIGTVTSEHPDGATTKSTLKLTDIGSSYVNLTVYCVFRNRLSSNTTSRHAMVLYTAANPAKSDNDDVIIAAAITLLAVGTILVAMTVLLYRNALIGHASLQARNDRITSPSTPSSLSPRCSDVHTKAMPRSHSVLSFIRRGSYTSQPGAAHESCLCGHGQQHTTHTVPATARVHPGRRELLRGDRQHSGPHGNSGVCGRSVAWTACWYKQC
ncbi:uncharacterized protein LOC135810274 [Sycon ciliatum]|uniref:uncharacterized protein LOC135810274 n=1 Tax=Sycon ciliatum TaxID=27933 RepID=UPI0031F616F0